MRNKIVSKGGECPFCEGTWGVCPHGDTTDNYGTFIVPFRNFTPHKINLIEVGELESEGVARLIEERMGVMNGEISLTAIRYKGIEGLPDKETGDIYIVSRPVAEYLHLPYIVSPDKYIRDKDGQIIGCEELCWFPLRGKQI